MQIYTTGAYLEPVQTRDKKWRWVVVEFEGDSYMDGELVNPTEMADHKSEMIIKED